MDKTTRNGRMRRLINRLYMSSGVAMAALLSWYLMVDRAREVQDIAPAELNAPMDLGRVSLTPLELQIARDGPAPQLVLRAMVENITGETQDAPFGFPPRFPAAQAGDATLADPQIILSRDDEPLRQLQPRMAEEVLLIWDLPDPPPDPVAITFFRQQFKLRDNIYGRANWLGHTPAARLVMAQDGT